MHSVHLECMPSVSIQNLAKRNTRPKGALYQLVSFTFSFPLHLCSISPPFQPLFPIFFSTSPHQVVLHLHCIRYCIRHWTGLGVVPPGLGVRVGLTLILTNVSCIASALYLHCIRYWKLIGNRNACSVSTEGDRRPLSIGALSTCFL